MEYYQELGHCHPQHQCLGAGDLKFHKKWGSNFASKQYMVNPKIQHHQPCVLPPKFYGKMTTLHLHLLLPITFWQRSIPLFPPFSNSHFSLWHRNQNLHNLHGKRVNINYTAVFTDIIFGFCYQHQVIEVIRL